MPRKLLISCVFALVALVSPVLAEPFKLVMVEQVGCHWCEKWDAEVAPEYPKTAEGQAAPLERVMIRMLPLDGLETTSRVVYTPTFLLVRDGVELARIEGYPGEDFFWGLLARMIDENSEGAPQG
ncbi:hypothetical protein [Cognatishimia sp. MH4019]|uniref:hypothetical protein n=1 Tax=Cognatishimia sp. MH4019 TaxID=2854030 RepID=UPI001CD242CF|nr:hypothetical protein [Cognatishimia sp. MH4019]